MRGKIGWGGEKSNEIFQESGEKKKQKKELSVKNSCIRFVCSCFFVSSFYRLPSAANK